MDTSTWIAIGSLVVSIAAMGTTLYFSFTDRSKADKFRRLTQPRVSVFFQRRSTDEAHLAVQLRIENDSQDLWTLSSLAVAGQTDAEISLPADEIPDEYGNVLDYKASDWCKNIKLGDVGLFLIRPADSHASLTVTIAARSDPSYVLALALTLQ